ncbi:TetR/AcrR family transcriptional regulator [Geodermatophilus sp. SYSU D01186]
MRRTQAEAAQTRTAILRAGLTVFARRGFTAATLAEIGAAAGLTRGAVYHHFSDKADLYLTAVTEAWAEQLEALGPGLAGPGDAADRLRAFLTAFSTALRSDPAFQELLTVTVGGVDSPSTSAEGHDVKGKALAGLLGQLTDVCEELRDAGRLRPALAPTAAARAVLATLSGTVLLSTVDPGLVFDSDDGVAALTDATLHGLLVDPT